MYGQARRKRYEVTLVRVSPWDNRVYCGKKNMRSRRIMKKVSAIVLSVFLGLSVCLSIIYFYDQPEVKETKVISQNEVLSSGPAEEPMVSEQEIVVPEEQEPRIPVIAIDPGHGGDDEGCSRGDVYEKEINLEIAGYLSTRLQELGFDVVMTREDNRTALSLEERVRIAEDSGADIYVSIHQNACEQQESSVQGIETWYCKRTEGSERLARLVHKGALEKTGAKERQICESSDLYVLRETSIPACLIETGFLSDSGERKLLCDPIYQDKIAAGIAWGIYYYFYPKTMYLTFDDGPSEENTAAVLDILKEYNIQATFFVVGENVRRHPEVARRIVEEGHTIGIHCNRHEYGELYESVDSYLADFREAYDAVYEVTGVEAKLFRFPGGSLNSYNKDVYEDIIAEMTDRGFIYFDWNGSLEDAVSKSTPEQLVENAVESTLGRKKVVMLAHDIVYNTTLCLENLIDSLPEYKMEPLTEEVTPIRF